MESDFEPKAPVAFVMVKSIFKFLRELQISYVLCMLLQSLKAHHTNYVVSTNHQACLR